MGRFYGQPALILTNMKLYGSIIVPFILLMFVSSCENNGNVDREEPSIDLSIPDAFPVNCDTLYFGESFQLKWSFSDNTELGSYRIDIHDNFDQHSHSTEVTECNLDTKKTPVNPYEFIEEFSIPAGLKEYETNLSFSIPSGNGKGSYDTGDYHFFVSLTDRTGWTAMKGLSIKILTRE
jgi:hypothetical protein